MASQLNRGEIWLYTFKPPDKRRPVLILTRPGALHWLNTATVAPITSTIRGAPSEVIIGIDEGLKTESAVNLDHIQTVDKRQLRQFVGSLGAQKMRDVCKALVIATGCDV